MVSLAFPLRRAFVALPLMGEAQEHFRALQECLAPYASFLRFQKPEQPHLTLVFWETLLEIEYAQVMRVLPKIAARMHPFTLSLGGVTTLGEKGGESVLFLTPAFSPELAVLKKLCPWPNEHPFLPHVTLARITHPERFVRAKKRIFKLLSDVPFPWTVDRLRFYAEISEVRQTPIEDFALEGGFVTDGIWDRQDSAR